MTASTRCDSNKKATTTVTSCTVATSTYIGFVKCNFDVAICMTNNKVGVGACNCDQKGNVIAAMK
jgi:hypothetical protein